MATDLSSNTCTNIGDQSSSLTSLFDEGLVSVTFDVHPTASDIPFFLHVSQSRPINKRVFIVDTHHCSLSNTILRESITNYVDLPILIAYLKAGYCIEHRQSPIVEVLESSWGRHVLFDQKLQVWKKRTRLYQPKDALFTHISSVRAPKFCRERAGHRWKWGEESRGPAQGDLADPPTLSGAEPGEDSVRSGGR
ncbi:hypothetical protein F2Q70_00043870 [Brassica cretica]|uniref:Uncharacterized protein n=1 Tax=Brassica cretica TaxID=69181 RepID=A0A8S9KGX3_BRACR|nr:hypothetical protein F2Q70_00043870 [Brassica cretica]